MMYILNNGFFQGEFESAENILKLAESVFSISNPSSKFWQYTLQYMKFTEAIRSAAWSAASDSVVNISTFNPIESKIK